MKTPAHSPWIVAMVAVMAFLVWSGASVQAQESQLPFPQTQLPPPVYHRPHATPTSAPSSSGVVTIPQLQQAQPKSTPPPAPIYRSVPQPAPVAPPPLPAIFRGCWQGRVDYVDTIQRLPGGARIGPWTPKTYRLCYRQTGNAPFELTFTEAGVAQSNKITNASGKMEVVSTDGRTYASMRSLLHFDEYRLASDSGSGPTFPVDELTQLQCNVRPDGMHVTGSVYGERDGAPWFRSTWHATFVHTADERSVPE